MRADCIKCVLAHNAANRLINGHKYVAAAKEKRLANPEPHREHSRRYFHNNREKVLESNRSYYHGNVENRSIYNKQWRIANEEHIREKNKRDAAKLAAKCARRRAALKRATVAWADNVEIQKFYDEAKRLTDETGIEHHVDHWIPLTNKNVCGLHVHQNLRVITGSENSTKNNKFVASEHESPSNYTLTHKD